MFVWSVCVFVLPVCDRINNIFLFFRYVLAVPTCVSITTEVVFKEWVSVLPVCMFYRCGLVCFTGSNVVLFALPVIPECACLFSPLRSCFLFEQCGCVLVVSMWPRERWLNALCSCHFHMLAGEISPGMQGRQTYHHHHALPLSTLFSWCLLVGVYARPWADVYVRVRWCLTVAHLSIPMM